METIEAVNQRYPSIAHDTLRAPTPRELKLYAATSQRVISVARLVARGNTWRQAIRFIYPKATPEEIAQHISDYRYDPDMPALLETERRYLNEADCLSRIEKRSVLATLVRDSEDTEVMLKAIQVDNKMTGDDVTVVRDERKEAYVLRAGDVTEVCLEEDCIG